jgi:hypothetical protein
MTERFDPEKFRRDIVKLTAPISTPSKLRSFLESRDVRKNNHTRLIAWLISFNFLSHGPDGIVSGLAGIRDRYFALAQDTLGDNLENPLAALSETDAKLISEDIERGGPGFAKSAGAIRLQEHYFSFVELHARRILAVLAKTNPRYSYTQGYDRFVNLLYVICLNFSVKLRNSTDVVEGLTFFLAQALISQADLLDTLQYTDRVAIHYQKLDRKIKRQSNDLYRILKKYGQSSFYFALRWELLMFADEHPVPEVYLLWDTLIAHQRNYAKYRTAMCLAHIRQVPVEDSATMIANLQDFKNWDIVRILNDTDRIVNGGPPPLAVAGVTTFAIAVAAAAILLSARSKRH